jgi:hypothetical protein
MAPPVAAGSAAAAESEVSSMGRGQTEAMEVGSPAAPGPAAGAFPEIVEPQVALVHVEAAGGAVAGEGGDNGVKYQVFESLEQAQAYAIEAVRQSPGRQCVIYDHANRELLVVGGD